MDGSCGQTIEGLHFVVRGHRQATAAKERAELPPQHHPVEMRVEAKKKAMQDNRRRAMERHAAETALRDFKVFLRPARGLRTHSQVARDARVTGQFVKNEEGEQKHGNLVRAWRRALTTDDSMVCRASQTIVTIRTGSTDSTGKLSVAFL
eukprot:1125996-Amphidinium_carterae.1